MHTDNTPGLDRRGITADATTAYPEPPMRQLPLVHYPIRFRRGRGKGCHCVCSSNSPSPGAEL